MLQEKQSTNLSNMAIYLDHRLSTHGLFTKTEGLRKRNNSLFVSHLASSIAAQIQTIRAEINSTIKELVS